MSAHRSFALGKFFRGWPVSAMLTDDDANVGAYVVEKGMPDRVFMTRKPREAQVAF